MAPQLKCENSLGAKEFPWGVLYFLSSFGSIHSIFSVTVSNLMGEALTAGHEPDEEEEQEKWKGKRFSSCIGVQKGGKNREYFFSTQIIS